MIEFELPARALAQCLRAVSAASDRRGRTHIPIFANALIKISGGHLRACATDLDHWMACEVDCVGSGELTVNAAHLESIASTVDGGAPIKARMNGGEVLELSQGRARFKLPTLPVADFPDMGVKKVLHSWSFSSAEFAAKLKILEPSTEPEGGSRYYLSGVFFDLAAGKLAATNGHVLGAINLAGLTLSDAKGFILPRGAIPIINSLCKESDEIAMSLHEDGNTAQFMAGPTIFRTKLINGEFPDYARVIPTHGKTSGTIKCADFLRTLACAKNADEINGSVRAELNFTDKEILVSSADTNGRYAADVCEWSAERGGDLAVAFDGDLLLWATSSLGESAVLRLEIEDAMAPLVVTNDDDKERASVRIAMPRR